MYINRYSKIRKFQKLLKFNLFQRKIKRKEVVLNLVPVRLPKPKDLFGIFDQYSTRFSITARSIEYLS